MRTIATICARGGSTGVPGKNIRLLHGKPLIVYTIEQALACREIEAVYVSTDADDIADVARRAGATVPFKRPADLATAAAPKLPVIRHLVEGLEAKGVHAERIVDLDPTSPLREVADIQACLALLEPKVDVVITAYESDKNPYFNMVERHADGSVRLVKAPEREIAGRQDAPKVYAMNASIYVWHRHTLARGLWKGTTRLHVMPRERSIDVDSEFDFTLVEMLMSRKPRRT